jgi:hypothetical protein
MTEERKRSSYKLKRIKNGKQIRTRGSGKNPPTSLTV